MKPKDKSKKSIMDAVREQIESLGTVVDERWWVEEYRPAYNTGGYYDEDIPEKIISRSNYFPSQSAAEKYLDTMEPDRGYQLRIKHQKCYERLERRWI